MLMVTSCSKAKNIILNKFTMPEMLVHFFKLIVKYLADPFCSYDDNQQICLKIRNIFCQFFVI